MKLAEALIRRADCQKRIAQLKGRLLTNAKVQEGDKPAETPQELIAELERVSAELFDLIKRINKACCLLPTALQTVFYTQTKSKTP